ncbi:MAG: methyltransferase [Opitutaceae bacterium]|nr:methyltransferase [Opitutaceae bacterium]
MPALALAPALRPAPRIVPRPGPGLELPAVSFFGRSLAEYAQCFALDLAALKGRDVLDVGAGPSSFTVEACARKIDAVAIDPLYGEGAEALAARVETDYTRMFGQMRAKRRLFRLNSFSSLAAAEIDRRAAAQRFIADYEARFYHGRYVGGALPRLPFFDGTFDLVLCAHLLFLHAAQFDFDWHLAAGRELVRVSAGEVRIHPICGPDGKPYPGLVRLRRELRDAGIASEVRAVDYEFFAGANTMLVLRRAAP